MAKLGFGHNLISGKTQGQGRQLGTQTQTKIDELLDETMASAAFGL